MILSARTYCLALLLTLFSVLNMNVRASAFADEVRVHLMDNLDIDAISITPKSGSVMIYAGSESFAVKNGELISVTRRGNQIELKAGRRRVTSTFISIEGPSGGSFDVQVPRMSKRSYSGSLEIRTQGNSQDLNIVNRVPLEDYVASVIGSEYGLNDLEGAKAMAVVARTYALHAIQNGKSLFDNQSSQVYRGLSHATEASRRAAQQTAGQVLTHGGNLIEAVYSASNGGFTASNNSVWGSAQLPYLKSRKDPWDASTSPHAKWDWTTDSKKLFNAFSNVYGFDVRDIKIARTAKDGRVEEVRLIGKGRDKNITGSSFRATVARSFGAKSLRSTFFDMKKKRGSFVFDGHGFGHGVGLSQWGAHGMALDGRSYGRILDFYYSGTKLSQLPSSGAGSSAVEVSLLSGSSATLKSAVSKSSRSDRSSSSEGASSSLQKVSNKNTTPKENNSTISSSTSGAADSGENAWNSNKKKDSREDQKKTNRKKTRRSGW